MLILNLFKCYFNLFVMKKTVALIFILCMIVQLTMAQKRSISGVVRDKSTNETLPGVSVLEKGTKNGITTNMDGKFELSVSAGATLVISYIGMKPQEVKIGSSSTVNINLESSNEVIDEVVIVGYGQQKKANLTGAVASVDTKVLEARPIADVGRGLQGTTPGLSVVIPSGEVGSDPVMKIRGQLGSIQGGSAPLILMDNVEIPSIQMLNPDDIESISVLKDAASASIYGAKAAFGVILITTKKGAKTESVNVSYSANYSVQNISKKMEMAKLDALEYTTLAFERVGGTVAGAFWMVTREGFEKAKVWQSKYGNVVKPNDPMLYGRDWYVDANNRKIGLRTYDPYDYMIKEWTPTQTHNVSVNGKSGKTDFNIGLGYLGQSGMIKPSKKDDFKRYNGSLRLGTDVNDWLRVYAGAMYSKRLKQYAYATSSTTADPWLYLYRWGPTYPMTTEDGDPLRSPAAELAQANTATQETNYTSLNGGLTITPLKDWKINFDYTHANQEYINDRPGTRFTARDTWSSAVAKNDASGNRIYMNDAGQVVSSTDTGAMPAYQLVNSTYTGVGSNPDHNYRISQNDQWNTIILKTTYDMTINEVHKLNFLLGMNRVSYNWENNYSQITQLVDYTNPEFNLATLPNDPDRDADVSALIWEIRRERRMEFVFEHSRLLDLKRWKKINYMSNTDPDNLLGLWINFQTEYPGWLIAAKINKLKVKKEDGTVVTYNGSNAADMIGYYIPENVSNRDAFTDRVYLAPVGNTQISEYLGKGYKLTQTPGW